MRARFRRRWRYRPAALGTRNRLGNIRRFSPPASPHGKAPRYPASSDQSNANPMPPGSAAGGLGVEQDQSAAPGIGCGACDIAGAGDGQRLPHRLAKPRAQLGHAFGRFRTVQLQRVQLPQCVGDDSIIRIDEQTDHGDLASCARCQSAATFDVTAGDAG